MATPNRHTTQIVYRLRGSVVASWTKGAYPSTGCQWLHTSFRPRGFRSSRSVRSNLRPQYTNILGPGDARGRTRITQQQLTGVAVDGDPLFASPPSPLFPPHTWLLVWPHTTTGNKCRRMVVGAPQRLTTSTSTLHVQRKQQQKKTINRFHATSTSAPAYAPRSVISYSARGGRMMALTTSS